MNTRLLPLAIALACAAVLSTSADAKTTHKPAAAAHVKADQRFLEQTNTANAKELAAAQVALDHATSTKVRDYANHMLTDHGAMRDKVAATAATVGVTLADAGKGQGDAHKNDNGMTTAERAAMKAPDDPQLRALAARTGADFDRAYADQMVADHTKVLADMTKASTDMTLSASVRDLAKGSLPTLHEHLTAAKALRAAL